MFLHFYYYRWISCKCLENVDLISCIAHIVSHHLVNHISVDSILLFIPGKLKENDGSRLLLLLFGLFSSMFHFIQNNCTQPMFIPKKNKRSNKVHLAYLRFTTISSFQIFHFSTALNYNFAFKFDSFFIQIICSFNFVWCSCVWERWWLMQTIRFFSNFLIEICCFVVELLIWWFF